MACFLGILHHERPGFLSYPASHLVPYLRSRKYPPGKFPRMYDYKDIRPRLIAKIKRIYKRIPISRPEVQWTFQHTPIESLQFPSIFDCLVTSPPYMNALDYARDNRLRLWFIDPEADKQDDNPVIREKKAFQEAIAILSRKVDTHLKKGGFCILIVGERLESSKNADLSKDICRIMTDMAPSLKLMSIIRDSIPDIRRARRNCRATKTEHILVYQKS